MRRAVALNLATIDAAIDRARELTSRYLKSRRHRRIAAGKERFHERPKMSRRDAFEHMREVAAERAQRRRREASTPLEVANWYEYEERRRSIEEGYLWAENRGAREVIHAVVRHQMASALDRLADSPAATQEPSYYRVRADRLRKARTRGHWGNHRETGKWKMFFADRSGLVRLDPSEARREQNRQCRRLQPELQAFALRGYHIYSGVFTVPNARPGELAVTKRAILRRFRQAILGCNADGSRSKRGGGAFPEIAGAYVIQEDPLSAAGDWNVHLNVLLVVDPKLCTPLDPELELELPPGPQPRKRTPRGLLCYKKLHYVWCHQLKFRKIEGRSNEAIERALLEAIKYPAKWISAKQLERAGADGSIRPDDGDADRAAAAARSRDLGAAEGRALHGGDTEPDAGPSHQRRAAPPVIEWPLERLNEWIEANRGFRRARGYGCLYRLGKEPPEDDERDYRMIGEIVVTPRGALVTVTHCEAPRPILVSSIHGDKSGADFPARPGRSPGAQARAGPPGLPLAGFAS